MFCTHRRLFIAVVLFFVLATGQLFSAPDTVRLGAVDVHALPFHFRASILPRKAGLHPIGSTAAPYCAQQLPAAPN